MWTIFSDTSQVDLCILLTGFCGESHVNDRFYCPRADDCICSDHAEASWVGKILLYLHWLLFHFVSLSKVAEPWYEDMYINNQTLIYHHAMEHFWKLRPNYTFNSLTSSFWIRTYNSVNDSGPGCWIGILQILIW